ncbi:ATP-binding protein [Dyadobacter sp. NIV53]|uniref:sensor histidine kinase n=1 Tax=Dyadobacter sp. NIV53 TaxID=2861765 RepID=UPI001C86F735|nr:PAS domain-containing sensor histidine kinase [Dyadobacter sp. NIV53]
MKPDSLSNIQNQFCTVLCGSKELAHPVKAGFGSQVTDFFGHILNTNDWPPRWYCGNWTDFHGWLYILSDIGIWAAYFAIPFLLLKLIRKRKDIPFHRVFLLFIAFILLCGLTHLMDAIIFWWPAYRLSALIRLATAIVSVFTVYALYKILPLVFTLRSVGELEAEIQKRRILEDKLAASEFLLSEAGRISRVGGWETDLVTGKRTWSNTVFDILGLPYDFPINGYNVTEQFQQPYRDLINEVMQDAVTNGTDWDKELILVTAQSDIIWVRSTGRPVYDADGRIIKLRGTFMDIDRYKITEIALNKSLELTSQNNRQLKSFTHILSHNIRNHASNLALISSLIDKDRLEPDNAELFEKIENISIGLNETLEDLSEAIKIKESIVNSEINDFTAIAEKVLDIFASDLEVNKVRTEIAFETLHVRFPRIYLESILTNLVSNAIKYRDPEKDAFVILKTYKDNNQKTVLECCDNGLGLDLVLHGKKLFGLYKTFHDRSDAHGVGLFLVKTQIESQGGQIEVESTPGTGSVFKIIFNE